MNKKYIDKEEWIERLEEELSTCKNEKRKEYLRIWINAIKCQPTLDEKEIIRKLMERIIEKLEGLRAKPTETVYDTVLVGSIIEIIKKEGNSNENT